MLPQMLPLPEDPWRLHWRQLWRTAEWMLGCWGGMACTLSSFLYRSWYIIHVYPAGPNAFPWNFPQGVGGVIPTFFTPLLGHCWWGKDEKVGGWNCVTSVAFQITGWAWTLSGRCLCPNKKLVVVTGGVKSDLQIGITRIIKYHRLTVDRLWYRVKWSARLSFIILIFSLQVTLGCTFYRAVSGKPVSLSTATGRGTVSLQIEFVTGGSVNDNWGRL